MKFWSLSIILAIAVEVGRLMAVDDFMDLLRKTGYAWVKVEIDVGQPLKLGFLIWGRNNTFW